MNKNLERFVETGCSSFLLATIWVAMALFSNTIVINRVLYLFIAFINLGTGFLYMNKEVEVKPRNVNECMRTCILEVIMSILCLFYVIFCNLAMKVIGLLLILCYCLVAYYMFEKYRELTRR